eukprot:2712037-Rhodomonas_salina.2
MRCPVLKEAMLPLARLLHPAACSPKRSHAYVVVAFDVIAGADSALLLTVMRKNAHAVAEVRRSRLFCALSMAIHSLRLEYAPEPDFLYTAPGLSMCLYVPWQTYVYMCHGRGCPVLNPADSS